MPTIGQTLKESREKQKISIDVAAKAVKVKTELLEDVEKDDFSRFAAAIYARGILRLYANFLGLEPETIVEEYNKINPDTRKGGKPSGDVVDLSRDDLLERRRAMVISTVSKPSDLSPRGVFGLIAVAIFLGVSIWVLSSSRKSQPDAAPSIAPRMTEAPKVDPNPAPSPSPIAPGVILPTPGFTNSATNAVSAVPAVPAVEVTPDEEPAPPSFPVTTP